jgi:hypothetical protein
VGLNYIIRLEDIDDRVKICVITAFDEFKNQFPYLEKKEYSIGIEDLIRKVKSQLTINRKLFHNSHMIPETIYYLIDKDTSIASFSQ